MSWSAILIAGITTKPLVKVVECMYSVANRCKSIALKFQAADWSSNVGRRRPGRQML